MKPAIVSVVVVTILVSSGCERSVDLTDDSGSGSVVFIINEGAFTAGNAELSVLDRETWNVRGAVFASSNPGSTLGDVANHAVAHNGRLYVAVNNSGYVQVLDARTGVAVDRIPTSGSPRQVCVVSNQKAYVTLMDSTVAVLDLNAGTEVDRITTGPFPEGVVQSLGRLFVLNGGFGNGNTISVIDIQTDTLVRNISTPDGPTYAGVGSSGAVYVVCTGAWDFSGSGGETNGSLLKVDPSSLQIIDTLAVEGHPGKIAIGRDDRLFILGPGIFPSTPVWVVDALQGFSVVTNSFFSGGFYGIGYDAVRRELYLSISGDFVTNGSVIVVGETGEVLKELSDGIGIAPNGFVFTEGVDQ